MKKISLLVIAFLGLIACEKDNGSGSSTNVGGDTNVPMNTVGNVFSSSVVAGDIYFTPSGVVSENNEGVITVDIAGALPADFPLASLIPASYKDASGNLNTQLKFKNTSEGIVDYLNSDGSPLVLVKYSASVGDKYILEKTDGTTITRTVTAKSTTDDYAYGFYMIKTITVEQDSRIPGVEKIVYNANHKFGLVGIQIVMEDGTSTYIYLYSTYNLKE
jgi:hypothetical protein